VDELKGLIRDLDADVKKLRTAQTNETTSREKSTRRRDVLLIGLIAVVIAASLFIWRIVAYSNCATNRAKALTGPGNDRINLFFQAYTEAAGQIPHPLTAGQKAAVIAELDTARHQYTVIPKHDALVKSTNFQLLALRDLTRSLHANDRYNQASKHHPVCDVWGF
jgi:hypothetical protein